MFDNLKKIEGLEEEKDIIFSPTLEANVYPMVVDSAYVGESTGGAAFINFSFIEKSGRTMSQQIYITNREGEITYAVKDRKTKKPTGEKAYLPGYLQASAIHEMITGLELAEMNLEEKLVSVYDFDIGKEVPQKKQVLVDLLKQPITLAINEQLVFKKANKDGTWVDTKETTKKNEIAKVFHPETNQTRDEVVEDLEPVFMEKWIKSYAGQVLDKTGGAKADKKSAGKAAGKKNMFG